MQTPAVDEDPFFYVRQCVWRFVPVGEAAPVASVVGVGRPLVGRRVEADGVRYRVVGAERASTPREPRRWLDEEWTVRVEADGG